MRLGKLAREYNIPLQDIISYLQEIEPGNDLLNANVRLDDEKKALIAKRFNFSLEEAIQEDIEEQQLVESKEVEAVLEEEVAPVEVVEQVPQTALDVVTLEPEVKEEENHEGVSIETDRFLELLESEDAPIDLSKITKITAPKKELSGLKVVGKIELAEQKPKVVQKNEPEEKKPAKNKDNRPQRKKPDKEELEKRRLKAKNKKEAYEARQEKRRRKKEIESRKVQKKAQYEQKIQKSRPKQQKQKTRKQPVASEVEELSSKNQSRLARFWRWFNT